MIAPHKNHPEITQLRDENAALKIQLQRAILERDHFKAELDAKVRALFAAKSEARHNPAQQDLLFNEAEALAKPEPAQVETVTVTTHTKKKPGRKPLDPSLEREIVRIELPAHERVCGHDGAQLLEIGVEASERLDIVPAQIKVIRTERVKYACPCCDSSIKVAKAEPQLLPNGLFTANALAWIIINKYQDALPLYRQAVILARLGGEISRNTLATTSVRVGAAVQPLINLLQDYWREADVKHMDETTVQVLKEPGRKAQAKSYFWARASDAGPPRADGKSAAIRLFDYAPARSGKTADALLADTHGVLMTDGYEAYDKPAACHGLVHLGCWVHARRYFIEAEKALSSDQRDAAHPATQILGLIGELYAVEKYAKEKALEIPARGVLRQEKSAAIVARIRTLLDTLLPTTLPKSKLGEALAYLNGQWPKLVRFLENGTWPLDNNIAENAIRPFVIGRKNWLFSATVNGAKASANLYSLIETAKANGVEPYRYLARLFAELPKAQTIEQFEALLPWSIRLD